MENLDHKDKKYIYQNLIQIDDNNRYEIYDGELILMSSPSAKHQVVLGDLFIQFSNFLKDKKCMPFIAPFDVRLDGKGNKSKNVVQPDLLVVCDRGKIKDNGIEGAPDFVLEILSKNNRYNDLIYKMNLYQKFGVREYWIVDIENGIVLTCELSKGNLFNLPKTYKIKETIKSTIFKDLTISLENTFKNNQNLLREDEETYIYE